MKKVLSVVLVMLLVLGGACAASASEADALRADVVVVGAGGAGTAAALAAAEGGASVILLEKTGAVGGSTGMSGGTMLGATEDFDAYTQDDLDKMYDFYLMRTQGVANLEILREMADMSNETIGWVRDHGVEFVHAGLAYDGYTLTKFNAAKGASDITNTLAEAGTKAGVQLFLNSPATALTTDENGRVNGVVASIEGGEPTTISAGAVVLACGGFTRNDELKAQVNPAMLQIPGMSGAGDTGDGIAMAQAVGAAAAYDSIGGFGVWTSADMVNFGYANGADFDKPGLVVNTKGERFMDESAFYGIMYNAMINQVMQGSTAIYEIIDQNAYAEAAELSLASGAAVKADTLPELAALIGVDEAGLTATAARYTELAGKDDADFGKDASLMTGMSEGPFYAIQIFPTTLSTIGGLVIDPQTHILDEDGQPIAGLFGAGELVNGNFFHEQYSMSGSAVLHAVATGRIAGANAAAE